MNRNFNQPSRRFRVADGIALALAIALFLGALGYYWYSKREPLERAELVCVLLISAVDRVDWECYGAQWFRVGDPFYRSNGTAILGYLERIEERPHLQLTVRDETALWEAQPFLLDLEIEVKISATHRTGDGWRAEDLRIAAGGKGDFRFGNLLSSAEILEVREVAQT